MKSKQDQGTDAGKMDVMKAKMAEAKAKQQQKLAQVLPHPQPPQVSARNCFFLVSVRETQGFWCAAPGPR